jgi:hypothetical protein
MTRKAIIRLYDTIFKSLTSPQPLTKLVRGFFVPSKVIALFVYTPASTNDVEG